jgi:3-deoxy-7-phosphoheptulonate synthase
MMIELKPHITEAQVQSIQQSIRVYSQYFKHNGAWALLLGDGLDIQDRIPKDWIANQIVHADKLYFVRKAYQAIAPVPNFGGNHIVSIAGPCSIESEQQIHECAQIVKQAGGEILRGGAFKPRSSCYDFQGLGLEGVKYLNQAAHTHGLKCVTEVMDSRDLDLVLPYVDIVQVGARNMQNFSLLKELGMINKPVLLKRGLSATYQEFLSAAEYILSLGNSEVILCERGIRGFEPSLRNTLDISAIPYLKSKTNCPVIVDPSHACGIRQFVPDLAYAAVAAGADGVMVEVHPRPDESYSDAKQTLSAETLLKMNQKIKHLASVFDKTYGANG